MAINWSAHHTAGNWYILSFLDRARGHSTEIFIFVLIDTNWWKWKFKSNKISGQCVALLWKWTILEKCQYGSCAHNHLQLSQYSNVSNNWTTAGWGRLLLLLTHSECGTKLLLERNSARVHPSIVPRVTRLANNQFILHRGQQDDVALADILSTPVTYLDIQLNRIPFAFSSLPHSPRCFLLIR